MIKRKHVVYLIFFVGLGLAFTSCSNTKYLAENEQLLMKNEIKIVNKHQDSESKRVTSRLGGIADPKANKKVRLGAWLYNQADSTGFGNFLKKTGAEPKIVDTLRMQLAAFNMKTYLANNGFFNANVDAEVIPFKEKKANIVYSVELDNRKLFGDVEIFIDDNQIDSLIRANVDFEKHIISGDPYVAQKLVNTLQDIVTTLTENGYYNADNRIVSIELDTLSNDGLAHVEISVGDDNTTYNTMFKINEIKVNIQHDAVNPRPDTLYYNEKIYYKNKIIDVKPEALDKLIFIEKGDIFNKSLEAKTINKLVDLPIVQYATIDFVADNVTGLLDVYININTNRQRQLTFEPEVSQAQELAISATAGYRNNNIFKGGDVFILEGTGGFEGGDKGLFDSYLIRTSGTLELPRLIGIPLVNKKSNDKVLSPKSIIRASANLQNNSKLYEYKEYGLSQQWQWKTSPQNQHYFSLLDVSYFYPNKNSYSPDFETLLAEYPSIASAYQERLIIGGKFGYEFTSQKRNSQRNFFVFRGDLDYAGTIIGNLITDSLFDRELAKFFKFELNYVQHLPVGKRAEVVFRLNPGAAIAYDNKSSIPSIKQFTVGGPNSMRAWTQRSLGPGAYNIFTDTNLPITPTVLDQRADFKIESNIEFRFPVTKLFDFDLDGALFTDAGNIWSLKEDDRDGASIKDAGLNAIAVGSGFGLRLDIKNWFVLRTDLGFKIIDPLLPEGDRMVKTPFDLNNSRLQFGIGMPFD